MNLNMNAILDVVVDTQPRAGAVDPIEFLALVLEIIEQLPKGHAELADPFLRAAVGHDASDDVIESTSRSKFPFTFRLPSTSTSTSFSDWHWH